jgi:hypothetical protein
MLTHYAIEVIAKDRLAEHHKEMMTRATLREAYGNRENRYSLLRKLWCRLSSFLARIWLHGKISLTDIELPRKVDPCMDTN